MREFDTQVEIHRILYTRYGRVARRESDTKEKIHGM